MSAMRQAKQWGAMWRHRFDIRRMTEKAKAFSASTRMELTADQVAYLEFRPGADTTVRLYDILIGTGGPFHLDLVSADFTPGTTEGAWSCMDCNSSNEPVSRLYTDPSSITNETILEYGYAPANRGPQSIGSLFNNRQYRKLNGSSNLLKLTDIGGGATMNVIYLFAEFD